MSLRLQLELPSWADDDDDDNGGGDSAAAAAARGSLFSFPRLAEPQAASAASAAAAPQRPSPKRRAASSSGGSHNGGGRPRSKALKAMGAMGATLNRLSLQEAEEAADENSAMPPQRANHQHAAGHHALHSPQQPQTQPQQRRRRSVGDRLTAAQRLQGAKFRMLNERLYTCTGHEAFRLFSSAPELFQTYHQGFAQQVELWPVNPLDNMIAFVMRQSPSAVVADFGCGEARLAASVPNKVFSFDLVACNPRVTACDMANVPLPNKSVDIAIFCLALMGVNFADYLTEARRVLRVGGLMKIAEVKSRMPSVDDFVGLVESLGFEFVSKDESNSHFVDLQFTKRRGKSMVDTSQLSEADLSEVLYPCVYKRK